MGTSLHSLHVRSDDRAAVQRVLEAACAAPAAKAWLAPAVDGWVSVFPEDLGFASELGALLSRDCQADTLLTLVHDSDILAYSLFRAGRAIETFESRPDYFGEKTPPTPRTVPRHLLELLPDAKKAAALVALLAEEPPTFAEEQFAGFARLLGLAYGLSTYDDLVAKAATAKVPRRAEFVHLPDLAAEKAAHKTAKAKLRETKRSLQKQGRLIFDSELVRNTRAYGLGFEVLGPAPDGAGFLAANFGDWRGLMEWAPPAEPQGRATLPRRGLHTVTPSRAGAPLIASLEEGIGVIDFATGRSTVRLPGLTGWPMACDAASDLVYVVAFGEEPGDNGDWLIAARLGDGERVFRVPFSRGVRQILLHPTEPHLIWIDQMGLGILHRQTGERLKTLSALNPVIASKKRAQWLSASGRVPDVPNQPRWLELETLLSVALAAGGEWLVLGTSEGLRWHRYSSLLTCQGELPAPAMAVETSTVLQDHRWVHAIAVDEPTTQVVYTSGDDSLRAFNWVSQHDRQVRPSLEAKMIWALTLSADRRQLACGLGYRGEDWKRHQDERWVQVWDFAALLQG